MRMGKKPAHIRKLFFLLHAHTLTLYFVIIVIIVLFTVKLVKLSIDWSWAGI